MDFDTNFNAETVKHYRASLPAVVSPDLLRRNMDFVLTDVGEYMEEWRRYIVLECWTRLENPHEHRGIVRDWLRVLSSSAPYQMLWTWGSLRDELSKEQQWLLLESVSVGNWSNIVRVEDLPDNEVARLRMMWWQHHFWVNKKAVELFAPMAYLHWEELMKEEEWTAQRLNGLIDALGGGRQEVELPSLY